MRHVYGKKYESSFVRFFTLTLFGEFAEKKLVSNWRITRRGTFKPHFNEPLTSCAYTGDCFYSTT